MLDPILEAYLFPDLYIQELQPQKDSKEKDPSIQLPKNQPEYVLEEAHIVKILEAATIGPDRILAERSFNFIRTLSINYTKLKFEAINSNSPSKLYYNGNGKPSNCLLTRLICNRHLNKVLNLIQGMNKQNQDDLAFQTRIGRFLEILRLCAIAHPESTMSNIWFLPWLLEFINFDVTYIFFIQIFGYGQLYQNWLNANDFFVAALNAAKELQNKIASAPKADIDDLSNDIDNKKLENLFLLFSEFLSLKNFRDKCQSPFRLSKMIKIPCKDIYSLTKHSTQYGDIEEMSNFHLDTLIKFSHFLCVLYNKSTKKVFEDNLGEYVTFVQSLSEIENLNPQTINSRISPLKVNFMELISIIIDGIDEKDDKRIEKLFSISIPLSIPTVGSISSTSSSYVAPSSTASSVAYVSSVSEVSSSSSVASASSFFNSSASSFSDTREQPPLFNSLLFITEASLIRPKNEFELQKALHILLAMIRKHLISDDEVADYFLAGLLFNYRKEIRPIQKMALYAIVSEVPSLEVCVERSMSFDFFNCEEDLGLQNLQKDNKKQESQLETEKMEAMQNEVDPNVKDHHKRKIDHEEDSFELDFISKMRQVLFHDYGK